VGENYNTWSHSTLVALSGKNKICFIDGSLPKPSAFDSHFQALTICNDMAVSWIMNAISKEISSNVIYITSCEDMWEDLKD
jgi:hypothetical protein